MQMKQLIELYVEATLNQTFSFPIDSRDCGNLQRRRLNFPLWEFWELWELWELWEFWELWELWESAAEKIQLSQQHGFVQQEELLPFQKADAQRMTQRIRNRMRTKMMDSPLCWPPACSPGRPGASSARPTS